MPTAALVTYASPTVTSATITTAPAGTALVPSPLFYPGNSSDASSARDATVSMWLGVWVMLGSMLW
jgi:hypothetical protein